MPSRKIAASAVYRFGISTTNEMRRLGNAFGVVASEIYERQNQKDPGNTFPIIIGMKGGRGVGKSTFATAAARYLVDEGSPSKRSADAPVGQFSFGADNGNYRRIYDAKYGGKVYCESSESNDRSIDPKHYWSNWVKPADGVQHRVLDTKIVGDYSITGEVSDSEVPKRMFPGIDFVEHAEGLPLELLKGMVQVEYKNFIYVVAIQVEREIGRSEAVLKEFLPSVSEFRF